ncbi:MAG: Serine phosphatase RsbU, regulator of sigma subunit [Bryobacterales bacterium]|nr:Serine phosphatase RsbU, regulator of sigma subunit [Bryobacterales bacterium]
MRLSFSPSPFVNRIDAIQQAIERDRNALRAKSQREAELEAAASIQQGLMAVRIPQLSFADVTGRNLPCAAIGGDFFSVVAVGERIVVSIADVCGKGIAAAVMASLLQRMIHEGLRSGVPLAEIGRSANDFFCQRDLGVRYATFVIVCVQPDGAVEDLNCAHVPPVLVSVGRGIAYRTAVFASAEEFLAADDRPEVAVCLVLDVRMPGLSGLDLQRCLTDKESTIPIIFVTAHADEELRVRALQQGAVAFLGSRLATKLCSTPSNQLLNYLQTSSQWGGRSGPALPSPRTVQACHGGADASVCAGPLVRLCDRHRSSGARLMAWLTCRSTMALVLRKL